MKKLLAILVIVVIGFLGWLNWERIAFVISPLAGVQQSAGTTSQPGTVTLASAPNPRYRYALLDPTTSTDESFRESMKSKLAASVRNYVPDKPKDTKNGVEELVGIHMVLRMVGTLPLQYGAPEYTIDIPSVPALPARPDMTKPGALDPRSDYDQWKHAQNAWSEQYNAATAAAEQATATLQGVELNVDGWSAVTAGVVSLALLAPADGDVAFLVMSDLDENQPQQPAAFNGHPLVVVQPDPVGDVSRWDSLFNSFSSWSASNGSGDITRVRPEASDTTIRAFVKGA
ncbi:hypothetical protein [Arthrobacter sp. B1I2]|uniref:hypothetical protein n=1 Tax=Arthrobacter sp. B1I2 TaxID=3042263 RepID=UPI002784A832|nr:hypothetical protein [Arthrobacter sp. B1I2]MDQ0733497.1 hypothetical protein [Arthrobacter sp. B1I2]